VTYVDPEIIVHVPVFTIGYGNRTMEAFCEALERHEIGYLIDVRSRPYSQFKPEFSRESLEDTLHQCNVQYVFMGEMLGGKPADPTCYTDGRVDYEKVRATPQFKQGIDRLRTAWDKQLRVAVMCAEGKPEMCHRSKLIGRELTAQGIEVAHIEESGELATQLAVISRITGGQLPLLGDSPATTRSRQIRRPPKTEE